ncbi:C-type mannose receptor 2-like [Hemibagrus wyckioides]|uniref:C-type mannose receptor 2-like n=1 Tax=Hemibagrus wyckioides TaxID=337641 RepID=UPI00266BCCA0|nr:C-type mannose receptor 2-like [Hemibagrus wyckioides]
MYQLLLLLGVFSLSVCLPRHYHFINENKTWYEAQRYCRENYDDLASINNTAEELAVSEITDIWKYNRSWIGLYDDLNSWKWSLDDDSVYKEGERSFRNWYIQKPRDWYGISLCVYLSNYDGVWWDTSCSTMLPFICYDGRVNASERYVPIYQNMNWTEAQRYCREHYTDLTSVRNETENQKIRSIFNNTYYAPLWIGLYRTRSWSDKSNSSFSNWKPGQPDNYRQNESCTAVSFNDSGKWTDENCSQAIPLICYSTMPSLPSHQYHFVNVNMTWTEAQRYCRENYTDLATIDNMEEMNTLLDTVNGIYSGLAWIGLYGDEDSWTWSLDDDAFYQEGERAFRGWYHQPDNYIGNEMCVYIGSDGTWFDGDCRAYLPFVCYDGMNGTENYTWINQPMPWTKAQQYCREHYTDLASVRNQTDNQQILNFIGGSPTWIGLYRTRLWSDKQESTYENWRPATYKQPDNGIYNPWEYGNQHCTAVSFRDSGHWTDENCLSTFPFICYNKFCTGSSCTLHQYHFVNENKTWTEAQRYCRENYTDLATIDNMEEMNSLLNTVNGSYSGLAWIGLYDDLNSWKWSLDNNSFYQNGESNFSNWYINNQGNWNGNNLCVYFTYYAEWWDTSCSTKRPFICFDGRVNASDEYVPVYQQMNWTEAQRYCREHYTDLTSVRSETENQKIRSLFVDYNDDNDYYFYYYYYYYSGFWIGMYRTSLWSDQSNSSFSNWKPGQPDNYSQNKSCAAVSFNNDYYYGKWTDENCDQAFPFLCYSTMSSNSSHQYWFVNENKTWTEAQRYCRENYTDLATIDNMEEMNTLLDTVNGSYSGLAWIGLHDDLDSWRWSLDDDAFYQEGERDFRGWSHQPDNYNGNEMCVSMGYGGKWYDRPCTDRKSFVCYNGMNNTYVMIYNQKTWEEAQSFCRVSYTDLANVRNETELQQILSIMKGYEVWIGLYRNRLWSDQSNSTFTYWTPESPEPSPEPDNGLYSPGQYGNQHCTAVDPSGRWTDENCLASFPFICYSAFTPGAVMGLRMKVTANENLLNSQIKRLVLMELQQELSGLGLSSNYTVNVRNIRKLGP